MCDNRYIEVGTINTNPTINIWLQLKTQCQKVSRSRNFLFFLSKCFSIEKLSEHICKMFLDRESFWKKLFKPFLDRETFCTNVFAGCGWLSHLCHLWQRLGTKLSGRQIWLSKSSNQTFLHTFKQIIDCIVYALWSIYVSISCTNRTNVSLAALLSSYLHHKMETVM